MSEIHWIVIIAVVELAIILILALAMVGYGGLRGRQRDTDAAKALVDRVATAQSQQRESLQAFLAASGVAEDEREAEVQRLLALEQRFYEHCIRAYLMRDHAAFSTMHEKLGAVLQPLLDHAQQAEQPEVSADDNEGIEETAADAEDITPDRHLYREALNRVFREYTAMFGVHLAEEQTLSATDILSRLESGDLAGEDVAAIDT